MSRQELHPRTAVVNQSQKNHAKRARLTALQWLAQQFPQAFDNAAEIQPLKVGIMEDILQQAEHAETAGISKSKLREAVVLFTRRLDYLICLKAREVRIDLQGNPVDVVTEEDAERATAKIRKRIEKNARNARKLLAAKAPLLHHVGNGYDNHRASNTQSEARFATSSFPQYPERTVMYNEQSEPKPARSASVMVKHRGAKTFDPQAVARLKEKLGLSRQVLHQEEA